MKETKIYDLQSFVVGQGVSLGRCTRKINTYLFIYLWTGLIRMYKLNDDHGYSFVSILHLFHIQVN